MRIYFYTGSYTHSLYQRQAEYPPAGVQYVPSSPDLLSHSPLRADFRARGRWWYRPRIAMKSRLARYATRSGLEVVS